MDLVAQAVPFFVALIVLEAIVLRLTGQSRQLRLNDAVGNLAMGTSSELAGVILHVPMFAFYAHVEHMVPWRMDDSAWSTWLVAALAVDFVYYFWHRLSHVVNFLWAAHVTHHQSEDYNLTVALRQGWLTHLTFAPFLASVLLLGVSVRVALVVWSVNLLYQFLIHTTLIPKLGALEYVLNTPSQHRVHHAVNEQYLDRNYGGILSIWDRMFGTYEEEVEPCVWGITKRLDSFDPVWANVHRLVEISRLSWQAPTLRAGLYVWVAHPAWVPSGVTPGVADPLDRPRYDPPHSTVRGIAVLAGTIVTIVVAEPVLRLGPADPFARWVLVSGGAVLVTLWALCRLIDQSQGRPNTARQSPSSAA